MTKLLEILSAIFETFFTQLSSAGGKIINGLILLFVGYLAAKIVEIIFRNIFARLGVDELGKKINKIDTIKRFHIKTALSKILARFLFFFVYVVFLVQASEALELRALSQMFGMIEMFIPKLVSGVIMLFAGVLLAEGVQKLIVGLCESFNISSGKLLGTGLFFFILLIAVISALEQVGINTDLLESSFNIIVGGLVLAFSIGYGFASKEILLNIISSFYTKNKYTIGQILEINDVKGEVLRIDKTSITLKSKKSETIFPHRVLLSEKVIIHNK